MIYIIIILCMVIALLSYLLYKAKSLNKISDQSKKEYNARIEILKHELDDKRRAIEQFEKELKIYADVCKKNKIKVTP